MISLYREIAIWWKGIKGMNSVSEDIIYYIVTIIKIPNVNELLESRIR